MKHIFYLITMAVIFVGCTNKPATEKVTEQEIRQITLEELNDQAGELQGETVKVTGMVFHVCKHGGQKMFIKSDTSDLSVLIRVSESIPEFDIALEGSSVEIIGKVVVSVAEASEMEHKGEGMSNDGSGEPEECTTEEQMKDQEAASGTGITYHIEATSFKEQI